MNSRETVATPFGWLPTGAQWVLFLLMVGTIAVFGTLMTRNAREMKTRGAGIVGLQRAGSAECATTILMKWGAEGRHAAGWDLGLDIGLIVGYAVGVGVAFSAAVTYVGDTAGHWWAAAAAVIAWVPLVAGGFDLTENFCLAVVLKRFDAVPRKPLGRWPHVAYVCSQCKFVLLGLSAAWTALVLWPMLVP